MAQQTVYTQVQNRRKSWQAITPTSTEYLPEIAQNIISRCLSLRIMEIPVREFLLNGLSRVEAQLIGNEGRECLLRNGEDEERHDLALNNCVKVLKNYDSKYESEAAILAKIWMSHPDHPIAKAATLENGIFFLMLPLMRRYGSPSLITTSIDISADEVGHVQSHRFATTQMNQKVSKSLDDLRKATASWIIGDFQDGDLTANKLMQASNSLMYKGIAPELEFTKTFSVPAFFESRNDQLPYYGSREE